MSRAVPAPLSIPYRRIPLWHIQGQLHIYLSNTTVKVTRGGAVS